MEMNKMKKKTMRRPFCVYLWTYAVLPALFIALVGLSRAQAAEPQAVNLYTYHTHQPFITGNGEGMTYDLAAFLSQRSNGAYNFKVVPSSRPRINRLIESDRWGVIPWVNPKWF